VSYLYVTLIVLGVNLLPAFGPPTWAILVFTKIHWHLNSVALVALGCLAAVTGRYLLARMARRFQRSLPPRYLDNLRGAQSLVTPRRHGVAALVGIFVVAPVPSAQLFVAAGLLDLSLPLVCVAFVVGRAVSYSLSVSAASIATQHFSSIVEDFFGSPWSIALQVVSLVLVCCLPLVDWRRWARRRTH